MDLERIKDGELTVTFLAAAKSTKAHVEVTDTAFEKTQDRAVFARTALPPRNDLRDHSPDGFAWGYGGSGPSQFALAILAFLTDDKTAEALYQDFKWEFIACRFQSVDFQLDAKEIVPWLNAKLVGRGEGWAYLIDEVTCEVCGCATTRTVKHAGRTMCPGCRDEEAGVPA